MAPLFHMEALFPSSISPKMDSILHSHIYPQVAHVFRAIAKLRALLVDVLRKKRTAAPSDDFVGAVARLRALLVDVLRKKKKRTAAPRYGYGATTRYYHQSRSAAAAKGGKRSKIASFVKLQFTSSSSSSSRDDRLGAPNRAYYSYYDYSAWNMVVPVTEQEEVPGGNGDGDDTAECGYLCWLEEESRRSTDDVDALAAGEGGDDGDGEVNEIDRLAEKFIARLHAKFLQEKQDSYRRYQEMMARSV